MKVKIGDTVYDGEQVPVMVILTDADKRNIANMLPECSKYAAFPDTIPQDEIERWMKDAPNPEPPASCSAWMPIETAPRLEWIIVWNTVYNRPDSVRLSENHSLRGMSHWTKLSEPNPKAVVPGGAGSPPASC
jgi:hypothetical protein